MSDLFDQTAPDGTRYDVVGPSDGAAIVLIHGLGLARQLWLPHLAAFTDRFRVVNYDLFGHGASAPLDGEGSLRVYGDQIAALMDHLAIDQAAIVGFSIGGMINRRFAIDHGERASSLVILNSPHDRGTQGQSQVEARALSVRERGAMSTMDAALVRWFTPGHLDGHPEHERLVREWRNAAHAESYAQATWVLAHGVRELIAPEPPIALPTLVMTCENDSGSTPAMSHAIAAEIAGAETIVVDDLQHLGLIERPEQFTAPIRSFLEGTA